MEISYPLSNQTSVNLILSNMKQNLLSSIVLKKEFPNGNQITGAFNQNIHTMLSYQVQLLGGKIQHSMEVKYGKNALDWNPSLTYNINEYASIVAGIH